MPLMKIIVLCQHDYVKSFLEDDMITTVFLYSRPNQTGGICTPCESTSLLIFFFWERMRLLSKGIIELLNPKNASII